MSALGTLGTAPPLALVRMEGEDERWDRFVVGAGGTVCHIAVWKRVMQEVFGHECHYLAAVDGTGEWQGILPLVELRSRLLGRYLVSMPFLNDGGPLGTLEARRALAEHAAQLAAERRVDLLELRNRQEQTCSLRTVRRKLSVHLPLPASAAELWEKGFRSKLRSQIRRPMKEAMEVRFGPEQRESFYAVFARNMRDLGTPVLPERFFASLAHHLTEQVIFGAVYHQGCAVAAGCGFLWRGEFEITWASSLREFNALSPNMLLYWGFMEHVIGRGARLFNFGRCTPGGSTHRFKLQWGGTEVPLPWQQWAAREVHALPAADRPRFRLATQVWQRMPLPLANAIGPALARNLP